MDEVDNPEPSFGEKIVQAFKDDGGMDHFKELLHDQEKPNVATKLIVYYNEKEQRQGHKSIAEKPARIPAILKMFHEENIFENHNTIFLTQERLASKEEILKVHTPAYYGKVQKWTKTVAGLKSHRRDEWSGKHYDKPGSGLWVNEFTLASARYAVGGILECVDHVHQFGGAAFALERPPNHHAHPDFGGGFCVFNGISVAAKHLVIYFATIILPETIININPAFLQNICIQLEMGYKRILLVDPDIHEGDGTQAVFDDSDSLLFISMHK